MLVLVDGFTKLVRVWLVSKPNSEAVAKALDEWAREVGAIEELQSDNATPFRGKKVKNWLSSQGMIQSFASPYHPQSNGVVERMIGNTKLRIRKALVSKPGSWTSKLKDTVKFINQSVNESTGFTPNELAFGFRRDGSRIDQRDLVTLRRQAAERLVNSQKRSDRRFSRFRKRNFQLRVGDLVIWKIPAPLKDLRNPFSPAWEGPFLISRQESRMFWDLTDPETGRVIKRVHTHSLKPYFYSENDVGVSGRALN